MSDKPSLYVVEKKEVIILVVLFVLVTVLSFTLGVRYGESVGKKIASDHELAVKEHGEGADEAGGGTLGKEHAKEETAAGHGAEGESHDEKKAGEHGEATEHGAATHDAKDAKAEHKPEAAAHGDAEHDSHSPEAAAKAAPSHATPEASHEAVDKNSDEYLLNALKDAGVEPPGGKSPKGAALPGEVKAAKPRAMGGTYVIQVGSHPTRSEAESQVKQLKARKVNAEILAPFKDRQGEWHRVVIGSYKVKRDADKEAAALKGRGSIMTYFVWRLP